MLRHPRTGFHFSANQLDFDLRLQRAFSQPNHEDAGIIGLRPSHVIQARHDRGTKEAIEQHSRELKERLEGRPVPTVKEGALLAKQQPEHPQRFRL